MPAPTLTRPATAINYGGTLTATAPLLRSALAPASYQFDGCILPAVSVNNLYGFRLTLPATIDISARKWLTFSVIFSSSVDGRAFNSLATNGLSILLIDSSGNWKRYPLFFSEDDAGTQHLNWETLSTKPPHEGYFVQYANNTDERQIEYSIALDAVPIDSSGAFDLAAFRHIEVHIGRSSRAFAAINMQINRMAAIDTPVISGGDATTPMKESRAVALFTAAGTSAPYNHFRNGRLTSGMYAFNQESNPYAWTHPHEISAYYVDSKVATLFRPSYLSTLDQYPSIQESETTRRFRKWSGYLSLSDFIISGAPRDGGDYDLYIEGTDTVALTTGTIFGAGIVNFNHGTFDGVTFKKCGEVVYDADATYTGCLLIANTWASSKGLTITGAPGTYTGEFYFSDNTGGKDITITPISAGNFVLPNISIKSGQTLKLHNASATHAITVEIPSGITTSTSTAGGTITVVTPSVYQSVTLDGASAGTLIQIYDTDTSAELYNGTPSSYPFTWTDPVAYAADRPIRLRAMFTAAATAKLFIDTPIGTATNSVPALSYLINQKDDDVYAANGKDGSTITGITIDDTNLLINVTSSTLSWADIYAYETYWLFTAAGIRDEGRIITALDQANYLFENFSIKNTGSGVLTLTGGYGRDATTGSIVDIIDTSGNNIFPLPDHVVNNIVTVGGSNVITGDIADILAPIASIPTNPLLTNDARLDYLDADISSRLADAYYTAPDNAGITAIKAKTDLIPANPAQAGEYTTAIAGLPTLTEIEASTLAKESTFTALNNISVADILAAASTTPISANVKEVNDITIKGSGTEADPWGPA